MDKLSDYNCTFVKRNWQHKRIQHEQNCLGNNDKGIFVIIRIVMDGTSLITDELYKQFENNKQYILPE